MGAGPALPPQITGRGRGQIGTDVLLGGLASGWGFFYFIFLFFFPFFVWRELGVCVKQMFETAECVCPRADLAGGP